MTHASTAPKRRKYKGRKSKDAKAAEYRDHLARASERTREITAYGQDIGDIPEVVNPRRRARAIRSFSYFCKTYFPLSYTMPWAQYHKDVAQCIETAVNYGGLFAFAVPRGGGKSVICVWGVLWSVLSAKVSFAALFGASQTAAESRLRSIKMELLYNDLLMDDFPEVCYPIRKLGNSARRAEGQKHSGRSTGIQWSFDKVVFATVWQENGERYPASGSVITAHGLTGEVRGQNHTLMTGEVIRPQFALCDDPQTRESAKSPSQSRHRTRILAGDIAYLAGPTTTIAVVMPCTVISADDMADRMLNQDLHPEWQGRRVKMVEQFPEDEDLWDEYADIYRRCMRVGDGYKAANAFYRKHRKAMDKGAVVTWKHRKNKNEVSAIQHAMNLRIRDLEAFEAEAQNSPPRDEVDIPVLTSLEISAKVGGYERNHFPPPVEQLTAFIDVQGKLLYWMVAGWEQNFTGHLMDYGTWPPQNREYFTLREVRKTLKRRYPGTDDEAAIFAGIQELVDLLATKVYVRDDEAEMFIGRILVDANWGNTSALVNSALRQSPHAGILTPSYGRGITAAQQPISMWQQSKGTKFGPEWVPTKAKGRQLRGVIFDSNYWKKRFHDALALPLGSKACISLFKLKGRSQRHQMVGDHLAAEVPKTTQHGQRVVHQWVAKPGQDNHYFDCAVGCMLAASVAGISSEGHGRQRDARTIPAQRVKYL